MLEEEGGFREVIQYIAISYGKYNVLKFFMFSVCKYDGKVLLSCFLCHLTVNMVEQVIFFYVL